MERQKGKRSRIDWDRIGEKVIELYEAGTSPAELGEVYGTSSTSMYNFLVKKEIIQPKKRAPSPSRPVTASPGTMTPKPAGFSKREYWLVWKLIDSLRSRGIAFEGPAGEFSRDFDLIRDACIDQAFDYKPE